MNIVFRFVFISILFFVNFNWVVVNFLAFLIVVLMVVIFIRFVRFIEEVKKENVKKLIEVIVCSI